MPLRAVIVEDHDALSTGLALVLGKGGIDVVGFARTEQEGFEVVARERPGVAIVDLGLADGSGVELTRRLAAADPQVGVLVYTGLEDHALLREALGCGARGLALKASPAQEIVIAAHAVGAGQSYIDPHLAGVLDDGPSAPGVELSPREQEVLALLGAGLKGPEVAERLRISPETVRTHVDNAMERLEARTRAQAIAIALHHELIEIPDSTY